MQGGGDSVWTNIFKSTKCLEESIACIGCERIVYSLGKSGTKDKSCTKVIPLSVVLKLW